jgi:sugar phosphate isomerase/epimerase
LIKGLAAMIAMDLTSSVSAKSAESSLFFRSRGLPIGLQIYTVQEQANKDLAATLAEIASIGFRTIEISHIKNVTPAELAVELRRAGLSCDSIQVNPVGDTSKLAGDAHALGAKTVTTSMVAQLAAIPADQGAATARALLQTAASMSRDDWTWNAEKLNETGAALQKEGLKFAYHNHNHELQPRFDGLSGYDILLRETDPLLVSFEIDVGWAAAAGRDPVELLRAYPGRFTHMHIKDVTRTSPPSYTFNLAPADLGSGVLDWGRILPAGYKSGVRHFYVEREPPYPVSGLESARRSFEFLNRLRA